MEEEKGEACRMMHGENEKDLDNL